ncbi:MAG: penicillin-binding protein 2, partial [Candidatus Omnitrophica bacterium]|nr:penicillin-binding protein 2 [Candidatus Omnitrophota bacterium]
MAQLRLLLVIVFGLLVLRLAQLQVVQGAYYRQRADQNRLRVIPEQAPRGLIVDRRGRILASNQTVFGVALIPQELEDPPSVLARVSDLVHRPADILQREYARAQGAAFLPATIVPRLPKGIAIQLEEERWRLPGVLVRAEPVRSYPLGTTAASLLGYLSQPTADEFPRLKPFGVRPRELVGRSGVEQLLDHALRGRSGGLVVEVNHRGQQVRVISRRAPEAGAQVTLTIDAQLQSLVEEAFRLQPGAAVVLDPKTGEVLAIVSMPTFSPEAFTAPDLEAVRRLLNDPHAPLMNRATLGVYQPGSVLKLVTAAAALEQQLVTPSTTVVCPGSMTIGDRTFHCWYRDGHGPMRLEEALMQSCNVYFMHLGRMLGLPRLRTALESLGFSRRTGWPLAEQTGH